MEIPEWTPPILRTLYEDKDMLSRWDADEFLLLERFIFDSRMRTVWNAITKRTDDKTYPVRLFEITVSYLRLPVPKVSKDKVTEYYIRVAKQCIEAKKAIESLPIQFVCKNLCRSLEQQAHVVLHLMAIEECCYVSYEDLGMSRFDLIKYPKIVKFARLFNMTFTADLGSPIWKTNALLIAVVLNLPQEPPITESQVRSYCAGYDPKKPLPDLPGCDNAAKI